MICPYCNRLAEFVDNAEIYGRSYGKSHHAWLCRPCDARVGVHDNDPARPLGTMADKELREWRIKAHAAIDPIWRERAMSRKAVYRWLREELEDDERDVHIGEADARQCQKIIAAAAKLDIVLDERDEEVSAYELWGSEDFLND